MLIKPILKSKFAPNSLNWYNSYRVQFGIIYQNYKCISLGPSNLTSGNSH